MIAKCQKEPHNRDFSLEQWPPASPVPVPSACLPACLSECIAGLIPSVLLFASPTFLAASRGPCVCYSLSFINVAGFILKSLFLQALLDNAAALEIVKSDLDNLVATAEPSKKAVIA